MATGQVALSQIQIGKETVWGTKVAATRRWMSVDPKSTSLILHSVNHQTRYAGGTYQPAMRVAKAYQSGMVEIDGDFTFEDWLYVPLCGICGGVTGATVSNHKEWVFPFPNTSFTAVESRTIEGTDGTDPYAFSGCNVVKGELSGGNGEDSLVQFKSTWNAAKVVSGAITGALVDDATTDVLPALNMALYADDLGGTIGSTALPISLISPKFAWDGWIAHKRRGGGVAPGGTAGPSAVQYNVGNITLEVEVEDNSSTKGEVAKYLASTGRLVRLIGKVPLIATSDYKTLQIDVAGDWVGDQKLWDSDANDTKFKMVLHPRYDPGTFAQYCKLTVWNSLAAVVG